MPGCAIPEAAKARMQLREPSRGDQVGKHRCAVTEGLRACRWALKMQEEMKWDISAGDQHGVALKEQNLEFTKGRENQLQLFGEMIMSEERS